MSGCMFTFGFLNEHWDAYLVGPQSKRVPDRQLRRHNWRQIRSQGGQESSFHRGARRNQNLQNHAGRTHETRRVRLFHGHRPVIHHGWRRHRRREIRRRSRRTRLRLQNPRVKRAKTAGMPHPSRGWRWMGCKFPPHYLPTTSKATPCFGILEVKTPVCRPRSLAFHTSRTSAPALNPISPRSTDTSRTLQLRLNSPTATLPPLRGFAHTSRSPPSYKRSPCRPRES